jgi:hypothetical protein
MRVAPVVTNLALLLALSGCEESPAASKGPSQVSVAVLSPSTVRAVVIEVSGPGIVPSLVVNAQVEVDSMARATLVIPAGVDRRITVLAVDTAGIETHRGDTTVSLRGGENAYVRLLLQPRLSSLGLTVTVSGVRLTVVDTSTRVLDPSPATIEAHAFDEQGRPVPEDSLRWASSHPAFIDVRAGRVVGLRVGAAVVSVSYRGASVRVGVEVRAVPVPGASETITAALYRRFHQAVQGPPQGLNVQSKAMALESYGQVANFGMVLRATIPRAPISNQPGNQVGLGNNADWSSLSDLMRTSAEAVRAIEAYMERGATLESLGRDRRALGFARFGHGVALGTLAMGYDSVAMVSPYPAPSFLPAFVAPAVAISDALASLDTAAAIFSDPGVWSIPAQWVGASGELSPSDFVRLIRSYKAKLRAGVARTPAERAAVDWTAVIADASNGITADHRIALNPFTGWSSSLDAGTLMTSASWHQVSLMYNGMADTSGAYQAFVAQPLQTLIGMNLLVLTPDTRWPRGGTRAQQVSNSTLPLPSSQYFANRSPGQDQPDISNPWGTSQYDHRRWWPIANSNGIGTYTFVSVREVQMLAAEGLLRSNNGSGAMALINASRTANALPAFTDPVGVAPGGSGCVPKLPSGECGTLFEALKYEKRMETQLTGYMQWFIDSRGWGDLIQGTALHWPVPFQQMEMRGRAAYDMPSPGTLPAAGIGTYGF